MYQAPAIQLLLGHELDQARSVGWTTARNLLSTESLLDSIKRRLTDSIGATLDHLRKRIRTPGVKPSIPACPNSIDTAGNPLSGAPAVSR